MSRDLANGNTTVAGGFSFSLNQPMLHPLPDSENQYQSGGFVSVTQTLTKIDDRAGRLRDRAHQRVSEQSVSARRRERRMVLGQVPDARTRQTLSARLRQALPADTYLEADYRRYFDDWQVTSNTVSVGLSHHFRPDASVRARVPPIRSDRRVLLGAPVHGIPQYYTADFRLEPFTSNTYTGRIEITPKAVVVAAAGRHGPDAAVRALSGRQRIRRGDLSTGLRVPLKIINR